MSISWIMEFSPNNTIVRLCLQGMIFEDKGNHEEAGKIFLQAWDEASDDFEKYLAAFYVARQQADASEKLKWYKTSLELALKINDVAATSALSTLYSKIAGCYEALSDPIGAKENFNLANSFGGKSADKGPF